MQNEFFGEWVYFSNDEEKEKAIQYLNLWKIFLLKKIPQMKQVGHDYIIIRPPGPLVESTIGLKIEMKYIDECKTIDRNLQSCSKFDLSRHDYC